MEPVEVRPGDIRAVNLSESVLNDSIESLSSGEHSFGSASSPSPPSHEQEPRRRSFTPPTFSTQRDGTRTFEARPKSSYNPNRLSQISLGVRSERLRSTSPVHVRAASISPSPEKRAAQYGLVATTQNVVKDAVLPRYETIELYRQSAAKSHDPEVEFELAQYMVQTALLPEDLVGGSRAASPSKSPTKEPVKKKDMSEQDQIKYKLLKEAIQILRRLADRGHATSQYLMGDILSTSVLGMRANPKASFQYFTSASKHNHPEAAFRAALCLQQGWGTQRDAQKALKLFRKAGAQNQPGALYRLGMAYFNAQLGIQDNATNRLAGLKWLSRAVNAANEIYNQAPYELARIYELGYKDVVFKDLAYAVKLYARSAELNYVPAATKLGKAYEYGELGCPQDAVLSIHYYTIAALGGDAEAQLCMCAWYMVGAGPRFPRNEDEAFEWALRSAHNGLAKAQLTLGMFYDKGIGCHRDILQSTLWYRRAADNGDETALKRLREREGADDKDDDKKCIVM